MVGNKGFRGDVKSCNKVKITYKLLLFDVQRTYKIITGCGDVMRKRKYSEVIIGQYL